MIWLYIQNITRSLHTCCILRAGGDKSQLSKLRKKTGFPFVNCKTALQKFDNDLKQGFRVLEFGFQKSVQTMAYIYACITKAEKWLREQAQKEGWSKATKLQGRAMSQGLVGLIQEKNMVAMVEVNCETDFVARNTKFQELVRVTAGACLKEGKALAQNKVLWNKENIKALKSPNQPLTDIVALQIGSLGENIAIKRGTFIMSDNQAHIGTYVHAAGPAVSKDKNCQMGKYAAVVTYSQSEPLPKSPKSSIQVSLVDIGRQLAQHIVGMNPESIGSMEEFEKYINDSTSSSDSSSSSSDESESEEKKEEKEGDNEGKQETTDDITGIVNDEVVDDGKYDVSETRMLFQDLLTDSEIKVGEFLLQHNINLDSFARFECGEQVEED